MKYMLLIYTDPTAFDPAQGEKIMGEYMAFTQEILDSGEMVAGDPPRAVRDGHQRSHSQRQAHGHRRTVRRDEGSPRRLLPRRREGSRPGHRARRQDP